MRAAREFFDALREWKWWPLIAALTLIIAFLAGFYWRCELRAVMCTGANDEHCGREWIAALSGWAGAVIAAAAAVLLILQLRAQQLQTAFTVGDAPPTIDAIEHLKDSSELVVRIVNWNRRAIVVRLLEAENEETVIMLDKLTIDGEDQPTDGIEFEVGPFVVKGWEDRANSPPYAQIRLIAFKATENELTVRKNWSEIDRITATIQILGNAHQVVRMKADTRLLWQ